MKARPVHLCRILCLFSIIWVSCVSPHNTGTSVIVDTDMGLDDVRTIILLLHSPDIRIEGIVVTEGASDIDAGVENARRLLAHFDSSHIPVVRGVDPDIPTPPWREHSNAMGWVHERIDMPLVPKATIQPANLNELIQELNPGTPLLHPLEGAIYYLGLGPLSTLAETLEANPQLPRHISQVYFSGTGPGLLPSWNQVCDPEAYKVVKAAPWNFVAFGRPDPEETTLTADFIEKLSKIDTPSARFIAALHQAPHIDRLLQVGHLKMWDDPIALFLNQPELGIISEISDENRVYQLTDWDTEVAEALYLSLISGDNP